MTKKEFALEQIKEYIQDPSKCGFDPILNACQNLTSDGKMCVASKNYLPKLRDAEGSVWAILREYDYNQSQVFIPESVDILDTTEWSWLQSLHDKIAKNEVENSANTEFFKDTLFSYEELMALKTN